MRSALYLATTAVAALATSLPAAAQEFEWRLSHGLPADREEAQHLEAFAEDVSELTDGAVSVEVHPGGAMGLADEDVLRWLPRGQAEMGLIWAGYLGRDAPELNAIYVQGSVGSPEEHQRALPVIREIYREVVGEYDITVAGFMNLPMLNTHVFCRNEPVRTLEDLRQKQLRVWTRDQIQTFERLGVAAQIIEQTELYTAMQTGVVDCALYPARFAQSISLEEVADYASYLYPVAAIPYVVGVAPDAWASLPDEHREAIRTAGEQLWDRSSQPEARQEQEAQARAEVAEAGVEFLDDFPQEDRRAFLDAAARTWEDFAQEAGGDAPEYRERVLDAIGR